MGKCILAGHPQAGGQIGYGTYTGNGKAAQKISLGVTPKWVLVLEREEQEYGAIGSTGGLAVSGSPAGGPMEIVGIIAGGFNVHYNASTLQRANTPQEVYNYLYGY